MSDPRFSAVLLGRAGAGMRGSSTTVVLLHEGDSLLVTDDLSPSQLPSGHDLPLVEGETLTAAIYDERDLVLELVFESPEGLWLRTPEGGWRRVQGDELDGRVAVEVTGDFLAVFDVALASKRWLAEADLAPWRTVRPELPAGHLFLVRADIRRLHVDAWVLPTDTAGVVESGWTDGHDQLAQRVRSWQRARQERAGAGARVELLPGGQQGEPLVILGAVPRQGTTNPGYHLETVELAIDLLQHEWPRSGRLRLAVPALGTSRSGGADVRGAVLAGLVPGLRASASHRGVDVVLVLRSDDALSAARAVRRSITTTPWWPALSGEEQLAARALAARAVAGELTLFTGAGTSMAAGLPSWDGLLRHLEDVVARKTGALASTLDDLPLLDRATIIADALTPQELSAEVGALLGGRRYALGHALLANLPVDEAVTLNYDRLLEDAATDAGRPFAVLPYEPARERWLLKLHGDLTDAGASRDVVLTRADYLGAAAHRATLTGLVQAVLTTRHLLFVGFGLSDDHVHALVHDVRTALATTDGHVFGTALLTHAEPALEALWRKDLVLTPLEDAPGDRVGRQVEIFLDLLADASDTSAQHLFDRTWRGVLTPDEIALRALLRDVVERVPDDAGPAWNSLRAVLAHYGAPAGPGPAVT